MLRRKLPEVELLRFIVDYFLYEDIQRGTEELRVINGFFEFFDRGT